MKKIGITQRVDTDNAYGERRDCLDQRWAILFEALGYVPVPLSNGIQKVDSYLDSLGLDGFILSGGNDLAHFPEATNVVPERDRFEQALITYAVGLGKPVLGVCRGMQLVCASFGGSLIKQAGHAGTRHDICWQENHLGFSAGSRMEVNSYHHYAVLRTQLPEVLMPLAIAEDGTVEAFVHSQAELVGIMWHPEREISLQETDRQLFEALFERQRL